MELNTMELRHTPEILAIVEYLQGMKFKRRVIGGIDVESALDHISEITLQYDALLSACGRENREQARQIVVLEGMLEQIEWFENANAWLRAQNDQLYQQAVALWAEAEQSRRVYATG